MATTAAQLQIVVTADTDRAERGLKGVSDETDKADKHTHGFLDTLSGYVGGAAIVNAAGAAWTFLKGQVQDSFSAGMEANAVMAQTVAGLKSTHDASGQTAQSIQDLATRIMNLSGIDDDAVQTASNMLLTFTNIGRSVFPQATQAAADMATKMNGGMIPSAQQMQQQSLLLGKALNDPLKGITALTREGVTFSDQQKQQIALMIRHGDVAGAQGVILKELNKEFGGAASAAGAANGGIGILIAKFNNMKETLGQALIPILAKLLTALQPVTDALMNGLSQAIAGIDPLFDSLGKVMSGLPAHQLGFMLGIVRDAAADMGRQLQGAALPVLKQLGAFFTQDLLPAVSDFAGFAASTLIPMFGEIGKFILSTVAPALIKLGGFITTTVLPAVMQLVAWFRANVLPVLMTLVSVVLTNVLPVLEGLAKTFLEKVLPPIQRIVGYILPVLIPAFQAIGWVVQNVVGPILNFLLTVLGWLLDKLADLVGAIATHVGPIFQRFGTWLHDAATKVGNFLGAIGTAFLSIPQRIRAGLILARGHIVAWIAEAQVKFDAFVKQAEDWGKNLIQNLINGITSKFGDLKKAASDAMDKIKNLLGFHSPAKEGPGSDADTWAPNLMRMFAGGITDATPALAAAAASAVSGVRAALTGAGGSLSLSSGGVSASSAAGLVSASPAALAAQQIAATVASGGAGSNRPLVIQLDGETMGFALLPHIGNAARIMTGDVTL